MESRDDIVAIVKGEIDKMIADFIRKFWYVMFGMGIASAAAWYSLYYQVQQLDAQRDADIANTRDKIAENQKQIDTLRTDYKSDIKEIKEDVKYIRNQY